MNLPAHQSISGDHRLRVLRALGITPWARRAPAARAPLTDTAGGPALSTASSGACVIVLGEGNSTRELDLLGRALNACGPALARAARVTASSGLLAEVPAAAIYLVFGEAQARALGRDLPVAVLQSAEVVLVDELTQVLTDAGAKRRLWGALRSVRQTLAAAAAG